jgi:uncharacterized NAD(P)/FAD-binding protein YdhS
MDNGSAPIADVAIVGGGASGVMLAAELVRRVGAGISITLLDRSPAIGRGIAYATDCADHLLNVRADNMSAFADDGEHFVRWLAARGQAGRHNDFMPRRLYGDYLESLLSDAVAQGSIQLICGEVVAASGLPDRCRLYVRASGEAEQESRPIDARYIVLATGHCPPAADRGAYRGNPWDRRALEDLPLDASVLIVGTSLTMVDIVISLLERGHTGPITAVSRRGLMPRIHPPAQDKNPVVDVSPLLAGSLSQRLQRFRAIVAGGVAWHDVMQKLRGVTQDLWRDLDQTERRRFLRHLRPWWDVHRHRLAPQIGAALARALQSGQLNVLAGRVRALDCAADGVAVTLTMRGSGAVQQRRFDRVVDCSGPRSGVAGHAPLHLQMLSAGLVADDSLQLGLEVDAQDCALAGLGALPTADDGRSRVYALGPPTRARHWEINAVPDIRQRAATLAKCLADRLRAAPRSGETADMPLGQRTA